MNYQEYKAIQPEMRNCFFAFNNEQLTEGIRKHCLNGLKLYNAGLGLIGTKEGIADFTGQYDKISEDIKNNCNPQDVYDYEFFNHECGYVNDDSEAIDIVIDYFGIEKAKEVKRKYGFRTLELNENG